MIEINSSNNEFIVKIHLPRSLRTLANSGYLDDALEYYSERTF
jgi:hypothetical protein